MGKQPKIRPPVGYNIQREPRKAQSPYFCILAGQEAKMPCNECSDHKRCVQGTMRYKEQANMEYEEKAVVQVDDKGELLKCAKEYGASDCGFKAGAKVCGKCGAMPTAVKMVPLDEDVDEEKAMLKQPPMIPDEEEEEVPEVAPEEAPAPEAPPAPRLAPPEEAPAPEAPPAPAPAAEEAPPAPPAEAAPAPAAEEAPPAPAPVEEEEEEEVMSAKKTDKNAVEDEKINIEEEGDEVFDEDGNPIGDSKEWSPEDEEAYKTYRNRRLKAMGAKADELGDSPYACAIERKAYPGATPVCDDCPGGCMAEKGMPGLLEVEGMVEEEFSGQVIDSGYSQDADMFVLDLATKDDRAIEVFVDGSSAEVLGFHRLDDSVMQHKTLEGQAIEYIGYNDAADIAVKAIPGEVCSVEPDVFEGFDCFAVEIDGVDGKSYDVFVSLDGEALGHDIYEADEAEDIEAEAAEIALKRAFTEERRDEMAGSGQALPDGSYPIESEGDLKNAIQAYGRAKNKTAAKRHIMKRAKALGLTKLIPGNWVAGGDEKTVDIDDDDFLASLVEFQLMSSEDAEDPNMPT